MTTYSVALDKRVGAVERHTIRPLRVSAGVSTRLTARANVIVDDGHVPARVIVVSGANGMETAPTTRVLGSYIGDSLASSEATNLNVGSASGEETSSRPVAVKLDVLDADVVEVLAVDQSAGRAARSNTDGTSRAARGIALGRDLLIISSEADLVRDLDHGVGAELDNSAVASGLQRIVDRILIARGDTGGRS